MERLVAGVSMSAFPYTARCDGQGDEPARFFVTLFFVSLGMKIPAPTGFYVEWR